MKHILFLLFILGIVGTIIAFYWLSELEFEQLEQELQGMGMGTPLLFMGIYIISTLLILPTTPLNLMAGVLFGPGLGLLWTSLASIICALIGFAFTRTLGRKRVSERLKGYWQAMDADIAYGGLFYVFSIRLLPIIPFGIVNLAAGLTSVRVKDYLLGTVVGTVLGLFPFILLGSEGVKAIKTGEILPLLGALALSSLLVGMATWYRRHRMPPE
ncbi:TVP38/TMEM64 family protein [Roseofilum capinflatum]|uniref:TVP38/TMEM64 family membrane protein n=1 Tax=Roseofilum capinflatum BLCC-M114 TaxID=3022440 RepID=A0ABT7B3M6_9CYAN|nr:VTT domain-containing protein [Roseofilum capinflatum]MDJ1172898.1 VTT domain-containing protein [Roseofilum capinflatum BLCC-M114]